MDDDTVSVPSALSTSANENTFYYIDRKNSLEEKKNNPSYWYNLKLLLSVKIFILCALTTTILLFISTILQFWMKDFLVKAMKFDQDAAVLTYILILVTAPVSGIILGGLIVQKMGGYEAKHSILICLGFCSVCGALSLIIPLITNHLLFSASMWIFLFFGGSLVPNLIGITLHSLPNELKGSGNSLSISLQTILGFLPGPYLYGKIYENTVVYKRLALNVTLWYSLIGVLLLVYASLVRYNKIHKTSDENLKETLANNNKYGELK